MNKLQRITALLGLVAGVSATASAEVPAGYYYSCENKSGAALLSALCNKIKNHTNVGYNGLWHLYGTSDVHPNGRIWDMYSTKEWVFGNEQCGTYTAVGDCYNREHAFPKSWFNDASPMVSDAFHIYPTDGKVNGQRSNYPYGECANGTTLPGSGDVRALGRLGESTFPGYSGTVFEPDDEYKGDFARSYFYMAACYNDLIDDWSSEMLNGTSYPAFEEWAVNLLLKWHRQDPVSQKELDRNEVVYGVQGNRNPFIDYPELAEHIWGDSRNEGWVCGVTTPATINRPADGSTIDIGIGATGIAAKYQLSVKGTALKSDVVIEIAGEGWDVTPASVGVHEANTDEGATVLVTYVAERAGVSTTVLTLTSGEATSTVTLLCTAYDGLPAIDAANITDCTFDARWVYVGDADAQGCYTLDVKDAAGASIDGYPRAVDAEKAFYTVDGLEPSTEYTYQLKSQSLTSDAVKVVTAAAVKSVTLYYDGRLSFVTTPGEPSEPAEIIVDIENIDDPVTLRVNDPFQLSTDKHTWAATATLEAGADRVYMRLFGQQEGVYTTTVYITAEGYFNDDVTVEGKITSGPVFVEDFEPEGQSTYSPFVYYGSAAVWDVNDAGFWSSDPCGEGSQSLRFGKKSYSSITMTSPKANGAGEITFMARGWSGSEGGTISVDCSTDGGQSWTSAGQVTVSGTEWQTHAVTANVGGDVCVRIAQSEGGRFMFDYLTVSDFRTDGVATAEYHTWDAYCYGGRLVIESSKPTELCVYSIDGRTVYSGNVAGDTSLTLAPGLYIVATNDFARRVLVK